MPHFLKRLELNGFKSFAERTTLEFPAGIVAIVGPNGSGKSNVVDALRWLLGERDAKNLRGGKGEDLIFAGTQRRARVGLAQASLYFDNASKFFPVDFEEVVVSREIRRDGQNKYFLNRSEVLLRDLVDFFAKARLGSRGLVVIGQGDSDLFVRSSPLERRAMIEEILGLREYQIKKSDAERRLKNSRINLEKVQALVEEILPHLRSLKRQTGRWERRGEIEAELRSLENQFFGHQLHELFLKLDGVQKKIAADRSRRDELEAALRIAEEKQAMIEKSRPEEQKDLLKIKEEIRSLNEKRNAFQKDIGRLEARIEMAEASPVSGGAVHSPEKLLTLIKKIRTELQSALAPDAEFSAIQAKISRILKDIDATTEEKPKEIPEDGSRKLKLELSAIAKDLQAIDEAVTALRDRERSFETGQEAFYQTFKSAVAEVQSAKNAIDAWEHASREQLLEKERLDLRREEVVRQIEQAGRKPEEFAAFAGTIENGFHEIERRMFKLRGDLAAIGDIDEALVKEASDTETRYAFLLKESEDLQKAVHDLTGLMAELSEKIANEFEGSLHRINAEFKNFFELMFGGGEARLKIAKSEKRQAIKEEGENDKDEAQESSDDDPDNNETNAGVEIEIKLPRKKISSLDMLSGGERSLVGIAALFALVSVSPPPFLVLDEIDAPLDERNARRFAEMLKNFSKRTQFIVVTHNRATMEAADILYGVTLHEDGSSKVVSLKLDPQSVS
jgi:chromosome segregation ATPase